MDFDWTLIGVFQGGASEERSACSGKWPLVLPSALPWHVHPVIEMEWEALDCVQLWSRGGERRPSDQLWFKAVDVDLAQKQLSTWGTAECSCVENRSTAGDRGCVSGKRS